MLVVKIKLKNQGEKIIYVLRNKNCVKYDGKTYNFKPDCFYIAKYDLIFKWRTIDFVEGCSDPIQYHTLINRPTIGVSSNDVERLVQAWINNKVLKVIQMFKMLLVISAGCSAIACIVVLIIANNLGVFG